MSDRASAGTSARWRAKRQPSRCSTERTMRSGAVSLPRMAAMHLRRCWGVSVSATSRPSFPARGLVKLPGEEPIYLKLDVAGQLADNAQCADGLAGSRLDNVGLVLVVVDADGPKVVFLVRSALADRENVVNLEAALLTRLAKLFFADPCLRPGGARGCSHGWSAARRQPGGAEPVEGVCGSQSCPGGAEEASA